LFGVQDLGLKKRTKGNTKNEGKKATIVRISGYVSRTKLNAMTFLDISLASY